jgi:hypothetical protein
MSDPQTAIVGLKRELKYARARVRDLVAQNERLSSVAQTLRKLAGLDQADLDRLFRE